MASTYGIEILLIFCRRDKNFMFCESIKHQNKLLDFFLLNDINQVYDFFFICSECFGFLKFSDHNKIKCKIVTEPLKAHMVLLKKKYMQSSHIFIKGGG